MEPGGLIAIGAGIAVLLIRRPLARLMFGINSTAWRVRFIKTRGYEVALVVMAAAWILIGLIYLLGGWNNQAAVVTAVGS